MAFHVARVRPALIAAGDVLRAHPIDRSRFVFTATSLLLHTLLVWMILQAGGPLGDPRSDPVLVLASIEESHSIRPPSHPTERTLDRIADASPATPSLTDIELAELPPMPLREPRVPDFDSASAETLAPSEAIQVAAPTPLIAFSETTQTIEARSVEIAASEQASLTRRLIDTAQQLVAAERAEVSWMDADRHYTAVLTRVPNPDSTRLEQVNARITSAVQGGPTLETHLTINRLAFSQFSQIVDRWDANVQLHDDQIVGRFHSNSPFFLAYDSSVAPRFTGKVTTAANGFRMTNGATRRKRDEVFQGGLETKAGRINLPVDARPFVNAPLDDDAFVQRFESDTHIELRHDSTYTWQSARSDVVNTTRYRSDSPVFLIAGPKATLFVKGTVAGHVLVYSPERIVIEGNLRYAHDPRTHADSQDSLGLVSDRLVQVARPYVVGRGDLHIDAAIFARRRFDVTNIEHPRTATLFIYGSLTAGTISATEPRYATKIEFDPRFDRVRPPGFPATNRFEIASWKPMWNESESESDVDDAPLATVRADE